MTKTKVTSIEFALNWESPYAGHTDRFYFPRISFWRDVFPGKFEEELASLTPGEKITEHFDAGILVDPFDPKQSHRISVRQIDRHFDGQNNIEVREGRFYPRGMILGVGTFPEDIRPCRLFDNQGSAWTVDLNHPLAGFALTLTATITEEYPEKEERGGLCNDIAYSTTDNGPGLQASLPDRDTDFFSDNPFDRQDKNNDSQFYSTPRLVDHIDSTAIENISSLLGRFIKPDMKVLDLMSGWSSHLPENIDNLSVTGLGLNREELKANGQLTDMIIHDLNQDPRLPFSDSEFDACICTISVEYLIEPVKIFMDVARVLKKGAPFIVTFSDRWFPPKAIKIWNELHPFERTGLVVEYFRKSLKFEALSTESIRGYPRPVKDKHFPDRLYSDPVFAVWGKCI